MRALYVGYTKGTENHGDEALIWIIRDLLAPEIEVVTRADEYDIALLGGGTLINQSPWLVDHFGTVLDKARLGGLVFGTGVGDLAFWGNDFARWVPLLERCAAVGVRGPQSLALLQEHGFHRAFVSGDPYLWLRSPVRRRPIPKHLGVNLGSTNNSLWGGGDAELIAYVTEALKGLKARGWTFSFFSVWSRDLPLLEEVRSALGGDGAGVGVLDARSAALEVYSAISSCSLVLGEKLHANAMAAVAGVPFVALEYQPKVRDFAASVGLGEWVVSTAERDVGCLIARIEKAASRRPELCRTLFQNRARMRMQLNSLADQARQAFVPAASQAGRA